MVELEEYELAVGDSILFHAEATEIGAGSVQANPRWSARRASAGCPAWR
jgi:hypothetical protein